MRRAEVRRSTAAICVFVISASAGIAGCGGGSRSSSSTSSSQGSGSGGSGSNVETITVGSGPGAAVGAPQTDSALTSVTVCVPGTSQCQTVTGVLVDTGSMGLRILSSALTLSLPQQKDAGGNPIGECAQFVDGQTWGPVETADIEIAGEKAGSAAIQVIGSSSFPAVPSSCSSHGPMEDDLQHLGANGILGVGSFLQDCGPACAVSGSSNAGFYYTCPSGGCQITALGTAQQVQNPVSLFSTDNNGVIIELPAVTSPEASATGSMIFGIGTQSNNGLASATVYTLTSNGSVTVSLNGHTYSDAGFFDTGSNAIYFLDASTAGMATCKDLTFLYCPGSTQNFSATILGANGKSGGADFSVGNADMLLNNSSDFAVPDLGGPNAGQFDFGLPFFFGRNIYTAIEGRSTPGGTGPFVAY